MKIDRLKKINRKSPENNRLIAVQNKFGMIFIGIRKSENVFALCGTNFASELFTLDLDAVTGNMFFYIDEIFSAHCDKCGAKHED